MRVINMFVFFLFTVFFTGVPFVFAPTLVILVVPPVVVVVVSTVTVVVVVVVVRRSRPLLGFLSGLGIDLLQTKRG